MSKYMYEIFYPNFLNFQTFLKMHFKIGSEEEMSDLHGLSGLVCSPGGKFGRIRCWARVLQR